MIELFKIVPPKRGFSVFISKVEGESHTNSTPALNPTPTTATVAPTGLPDCVERHTSGHDAAGSWWLWAGVAVFAFGVWVGRKLCSSSVRIRVDQQH